MSPKRPSESVLLDLSQFASIEDAMDKVELGLRYTRVFTEFFEGGMDLNVLVLFFASMISRSVGLHTAITRKIRQSNPHAVLPLLRALAEAVLLLIYVVDNRQYVSSLTVRSRELPKDAPKRKSIQALISHATGVAPGFKEVYADLCEGTHFGSIAMWAPHSSSASDAPGVAANLSWSSAPHWKNDRDALVSCAQLLELANAMEAYMKVFA
jgi:hypothetical protein